MFLMEKKTPCYAGGSKKLLAMNKKYSSRTIKSGLVNRLRTKGVPIMDNKSLAHTTWNCKYHIVFAPKYIRRIIYGEIKADI